MKYDLADSLIEYSDGIIRQQVIPFSVSRKKTLSICVATLIAGATLMGVTEVEAATKKSTRLKSQSIGAVNNTDSELARLRQQLEAVQKKNDLLQRDNELLKQSLAGGVPATGVNSITQGDAITGTPAIADPATVVAKKEVAETDDLGEVVVKGRQVSPLEKLKDTPKSVSVVTGVELQRQNTTNFRDIISRVGNVTMSYNNPYAGSLMIRGLGWASSPGPLDPSVGMTIDGVSYANNTVASSASFIDIDTFDVTRGPQGTSGGKNSSVGGINIKTRSPTFTPEANASVTYGERNTLSTNATVGGKLIEGLLAYRASFLREQGDGPWANKNDPNFTYQGTDRTFGRAQFLLTPTEDFTAKVSLEVMPKSREVSNNYVNFVRPTPDFYDNRDAKGNLIPVNQALESPGRLSRPWFTAEKNYTVQGNFLANEINRLSQQTNNYGGKGLTSNLTWNVANHTLTSITGYKDFEFDSGGGPISVFDIDRSPSTGHYNFHQFSQELKLSSKKGGFVDYDTGVYFNKNDSPQRWNTQRLGSDAGAYYANVAQYARLDANGNGRNLMQNSIDRLFTRTNDEFHNESLAGFGNLNFHVTDPLTINTGLRLSGESRHSASERWIVDQGFGAALNPVSVNNVQTGGFNSNASGALGTNSAAQLALANSVASQYFNKATYDLLTAAEKQQVADAKSIRAARVGGLFQRAEAEAFGAVLPTSVISPSYKFNENHTGYFTWQHGEKAGISQIVGATINGGKSAPVKSETSDAFELGIKNSFFDRTLTVNADIFLDDIKDYIQPMLFEDKVQTLLNANGQIAFTSGLGNVPHVQSRGVEVDTFYSGIKYTTLRFAGAFTDARYLDFKQMAKPLELQGDPTAVAYYDATGKTLPGAAKFTFNLNANHERPITEKLLAHANVNYRFTSSYNNDPSLSRYTVVDAFGITDLAIGIGRKDKLFDVSVLVKNVFDTNSGFLGTWNTYFPSNPRWIGVMATTKL